MEKIFPKLARWWKVKSSTSVLCELCPRACIIMQDKFGYCGLRRNIDNQLYTYGYDRMSSLCVDPIEKKPLYHFYPGTNILSLGTVGCNLDCSFCQNWQISKEGALDDLIINATPIEIANLAKARGCVGVAFTYNEPSIFAEFVIDTSICCHELGLKTVAVSNGCISGQARAEFYQQIDAANIDLKAFSDGFYQKYCGMKLQYVLDTILFIKQKTTTKLELTTLIIPGLNDTKQELTELCQWVFTNLGENIPMHFSAFHPQYKLQNIPTTPLKTLLIAEDIAHTVGLKRVYLGNVHRAAIYQS